VIVPFLERLDKAGEPLGGRDLAEENGLRPKVHRHCMAIRLVQLDAAPHGHEDRAICARIIDKDRFIVVVGAPSLVENCGDRFERRLEAWEVHR
jgi:hypothetical protein